LARAADHTGALRLLSQDSGSKMTARWVAKCVVRTLTRLMLLDGPMN
jgi:hypothetical protein